MKLGSQVSGPLYDDRLANRGRTYSYAVTAVAQAGRKSTFSNEVRVEIPLNLTRSYRWVPVRAGDRAAATTRGAGMSG